MLGASRSHAVHIFQIIHSRMMCQWQSSKTVASLISWDSMMFQWNLTCKKCIHIYFWTSIKSNTSHPYWNAFGISANDLQCGGAFDLIILGSFWLIRSSFTGVYKIYFSLKTFSIHTNHCTQSSLLRCIYFIPYSRHIPLMQDWSLISTEVLPVERSVSGPTFCGSSSIGGMVHWSWHLSDHLNLEWVSASTLYYIQHVQEG